MKILIAGEGGQGIQTAAKILTQAAILEGKEATYIPNFGVEQRGGFSLAFVVIDSQPIAYPKFKTADVLAILTEKVMDRIKGHQGEKTVVLKDSSNLKLLEQIISQIKIVKQATVNQVTDKVLAGKKRR